MELQLEKPIVFLDFEATGVDVQRDRIVQVACVRLWPDGRRDIFDSLVDPQVPIPAEAAAVHGITDAMVRGKPAFKELATTLLAFINGSDLGGFGICRFDIPMLTNELKRAGISYDVGAHRTVDAMLIFHRMEPRSLGAALQFYCGKPLQNAHNALADAEASLEVLLAQVRRYGQAAATPLPSSVQGLHEFCTTADPRNVDARGKFVWRHGVATFAFGKHQTKSLEEVAKTDRSYIEWLAKAEGTPADVVEICRNALAGRFPAQKAAAQPQPKPPVPQQPQLPTGK